MNQSELLKLGKELLKREKIEEAEIKAKRLLEYILSQTREEFIKNSLQEVPSLTEQKYKEKLKEVAQGKPLQYITYRQEFMGLDFYVDENVLIPQPDTEILVEQVLELIQIAQKDNYTNSFDSQNLKERQPIQILDLCTGSGAIAISIAKYIQRTQDSHIQKEQADKSQINLNSNEQFQTMASNIKIIASDISAKALEIAKQNAIQNQVENIKFIQSDMFAGLTNYQFDMIISNPPYIETDTILTLSTEVQHEPKIALDGGKDGLDFYKIILSETSKYLKLKGYVLMEIGYNQGEKIMNLWKYLKNNGMCGLEIITKEPIKDLAGNDRVLIFQKQ